MRHKLLIRVMAQGSGCCMRAFNVDWPEKNQPISKHLMADQLDYMANTVMAVLTSSALYCGLSAPTVRRLHNYQRYDF